eukprot:scaffold990_cov393-Prasinococcus_capsulatus_cf.AAC.49
MVTDKAVYILQHAGCDVCYRLPLEGMLLEDLNSNDMLMIKVPSGQRLDEALGRSPSTTLEVRVGLAYYACFGISHPRRNVVV